MEGIERTGREADVAAAATRVEIDDGDNSTKCDALRAVAQFRRNFPQFCAADNGAARCNYLPTATETDRGPSALELTAVGRAHSEVRWPELASTSCRVMRVSRPRNPGE